MDVEHRGKKRRLSSGSQGPKHKNKPVTVAQVKKLALRVGESKIYDSIQAAANIALPSVASTPTQSQTGGFFFPVLGTGSLNRIGKSCSLTKIRLRAVVTIPAQALTAGGLNPCIIRVFMVRDKEPLISGANPQASDIFALNATANQGIPAFQNVDNFGRFEVLYDQVINLQDPNLATTGNNGRSVFLKKNIVFKQPLKIRFNDTVTMPQTDQFFMGAYSTSITATPSWVLTTRCVYKDE